MPDSRASTRAQASARPIALVTGATAGLGAAYARALAARGHALILVARDPVRLGETATALRTAHGVPVETIAADLTTDDGVDRVLARIAEGRESEDRTVGVLVNNAGFGTSGSLVSGATAPQDAMVRLHVLAVHRLTQGALGPMAARGGGAIITVSSVASYLTSPGAVNYCATKAYQRIAMESLALEVAARGIYVQACCPGFTHTEFHQRAGLSKGAIPSWLWMDAERVVATSLDAMTQRRKTVVVPGRRYQAIVLALRFLPRWLTTLLLRRRRRPASARTPATA